MSVWIVIVRIVNAFQRKFCTGGSINQHPPYHYHHQSLPLLLPSTVTGIDPSIFHLLQSSSILI